MITTQSFIERSQQQFNRLSVVDAVRSSVLIYMAIAMLLLMTCGVATIALPVTGWLWLGSFFAIIIGVGFIWVKLYQHYELRSPVKSRTFFYRLSTFLSACQLQPHVSGITKNTLSATVTINGKQVPVKLTYSQNVRMNIGGVIPGTALVTSMFRPLNPRTWFLKIQGPSHRLKTHRVCFDFSARDGDDDPMGGQGIRLKDLATNKPVKRLDPDLSALKADLKTTLAGTLLKGTLAFDKGHVTLTLFDALAGIQAWRKPILRFKDLPQITSLTRAGIALEQTAFFGADKLILLSFS